MNNVSTFGAFTTARLGIYAAQRALDVTGHNITNINTKGYTRQRLDQISFRVGENGRYAPNAPVIGSGVMVTGVTQLRDPYLDIRFRNEQTSVGSMDSKLAGLQEITKILDEVAKGDGASGVLEAQFNDLAKQLRKLSENAGKEEFDSLVRSSAQTLAKLLNDYSGQLDTVKENQDKGFKQDISTVNGLIRDIASLNDTIFKSEIHGDAAPELRDQRDLMLDKLSGYMKITIEYENVSIGAGKTVPKMIVRMGGSANGDPTTSHSTLIDGNHHTELSIRTFPTANPAFATDASQPPYLDKNGLPTSNLADAKMYDDPNYGIDLRELRDGKGALLDGSTAVALGDVDMYGILQSTRDILTEAGEFSSPTAVAGDIHATTKRGIPYYQKSLDALAQKFASVMNAANTGYLHNAKGELVNDAGEPLVYTDPVTGPITLTKDMTLTADQIAFLNTAGNGVALGGALFSNGTGNDTTGITAANISISQQWSVGDVRIVNSRKMGSTVGKPDSTSADNILHIMVQLDGKQSYKPGDVDPGAAQADVSYFSGSFQQFLANTSGVLANDVKATTTLLKNYAASATQLDISRSSISGVDLNDEATNLMQFQKSYSAACRLMTTLDEALDKLINGTGMVGR